ncbi:MAG TPA: tRNA epoxyqueuosine(34) reductase QueG [Saprospiraceae bacterium]|nr:tRNA epoxyqueuosine(34) reductase QueG [Saprospiraceae bacterium]
MNPDVRTQYIKSAAKRNGFSFVGIARAEKMEAEAHLLEEWLMHGYHGHMSYMENHFDLRTDPTILVPGAKSVVSLMYNYFTEETQTEPDTPKISIYAYGEDYHRVIRRKLKELLLEIREEFGEVNGRCFVDSGPVLERDWARRAGIGWIGKNTLLINPKGGSYFFLSEIILDLELTPDQPMEDHCGTCTKCIDACPTDAIADEGYVVDGSKCISYLTIELREAIPSEFKDKMENWVFGCDICQQVCPWNRFASPHQEAAFEPKEELLQMSSREWYEITEEVFEKIFKQSAVKRTKYAGLRRNLEFLR